MLLIILHVNGRESDAGPAYLSSLVNESPAIGILPQDYQHATQPLFGQMSRPGVLAWSMVKYLKVLTVIIQ